MEQRTLRCDACGAEFEHATNDYADGAALVGVTCPKCGGGSFAVVSVDKE